ncbi:MAG: hypothetical protein ABSB89_01000 [Candidatus Bathyarchaeia archaeon]|jgi:hypothetical protein
MSNQIVGNIGLYYICYELSKRGWNVLPTSRNAKGVDLVIYSQDVTRKHTLQVKTLRKRNPVPFGNRPSLMADYLVICRVSGEKPEVFVTEINDDIKNRIEKKTKNEKISYWLQIKNYEEFKDNWGIIGNGSLEVQK